LRSGKACSGPESKHSKRKLHKAIAAWKDMQRFSRNQAFKTQPKRCDGDLERQAAVWKASIQNTS
jgi:hypothetical protein